VEAAGLKIYPLQVFAADVKRGVDSPIWIEAVIGKRHDAISFVKAWKEHNTEEMGRLLGYPSCCREFYRTLFGERRVIDHTWQAAINTTFASHEGKVIRIAGMPLVNCLLRSIGLHAVQHLPCSFQCTESLELGAKFMDLMHDEGYAEEAKNLREALEWPVEWSGLHGIAETRSPIVKICSRTDPTPEKLVLQWVGSRYPEEGARGLAYPYLGRHAGSDAEKLVAIQPKSSEK
jgi:hypothetical protein